jgi:hypothetical protein
MAARSHRGRHQRPGQASSDTEADTPLATNGWDFWKIKHPQTGDRVQLGALRREA